MAAQEHMEEEIPARVIHIPGGKYRTNNVWRKDSNLFYDLSLAIKMALILHYRGSHILGSLVRMIKPSKVPIPVCRFALVGVLVIPPAPVVSPTRKEGRLEVVIIRDKAASEM